MRLSELPKITGLKFAQFQASPYIRKRGDKIIIRFLESFKISEHHAHIRTISIIVDEKGEILTNIPRNPAKLKGEIIEDLPTFNYLKKE